ncbi:MAG: threonine aldolase family protein [Gemmatimonadales bacterium]
MGEAPHRVTSKRHFASDNNAGIHPEVLLAIAAANQGHVPAYGDDPYTHAAVERVREHFGPDAAVYFVFGGTGANVLGLQAITQPHHAVICAEGAHINLDECGAPERFTGCKLLPISTPDGKLRVPEVARRCFGVGVEHHVQPRVISLTQATELGTVYTPSEIRALADFAHQRDLLLHLDGARLANAAAALGTGLAGLTTEVGVDVLSFGGTKSGLMGGEAVIFPRGEPTPIFQYIRKQGMQLPSKMRFVAAQFAALLTGDLWRRNAEQANAMARRLAAGLASVARVRLTQPAEANGVFAMVPPECIPPLLERYFFYVWNQETSEVRWMTSFDTTEEDVDGLLAAVREIVG